MSDMTGQPSAGGYRPAGWYHAQGDPPGTQRYWDGSSWQGDPQPVNPTAHYGSTGQDESTQSMTDRGASGYGESQAPTIPASESSTPGPAPAPADHWGAPPDTPPPGGSADSVGTGGFLSALFDTKFTTFITGRAISVVYTLVLVAIGLITLIFVIGGLAGGGAAAVVALIIGPLIGLFYLVMIRLTLEFFVNQFRQTELLETIADKLDGRLD